MLGLLLALAAASPVPAESRQVVLSVSAGWDATRAILQPYEWVSGGWRLPEPRPRARELGLAPGVFPPGPKEALPIDRLRAVLAKHGRPAAQGSAADR